MELEFHRGTQHLPFAIPLSSALSKGIWRRTEVLKGFSDRDQKKSGSRGYGALKSIARVPRFLGLAEGGEDIR